MPSGATTALLMIMGMRNNSCRERVTEVLARVAGVKDVNVSLLRALATVLYESPCDPEQLVLVVVNAGYGAVLYRSGVVGGSMG